MADKNKGYIKLYRGIDEWRWFKDSKVYHVFSWLLIKANVKSHPFQKEMIQRGSLVTSYESIATACGLSVSSVRRVLTALEETEEISREVKNHYQIITVLKYDEYQGCSQRTGNRQSDEQPVEQPVEQATGNNQRMNRMIKNEKNEKKSLRSDSPSEIRRGTDEFRNRSHLLLQADEGTVDDIPVRYRDQFKTFADYWGYRNQ